MTDTTITSRQIRDGTILREDISIDTTANSLITKVIAGTNISLSSTGVDIGTGDVTITGTGATGATVSLDTSSFTFNLSAADDTAQKAFDTLDDLTTVLTDGSREFTSDQSMGSNKITSLGTPTASTDAVNKSYVDSAIQGLDWQDSVLDKDLFSPPGSPADGDRYIVSDATSATGAWVTQENDIAEYNGATWDFTTPNDGYATWVEDEDGLYVYKLDSTSWVQFGSTVNHTTLAGLTNDDHTQYHNDTRGDVRYYQKSEFLNTSAGAGDSGKPVKLDSAGNIDATMINDADIDHGNLTGKSDDDHTQYLLASGSRILSGDWDIGDGRMIQVDKIRARDADGLALYDDAGLGLFIEDGGNVGHGTTNPSDFYEIEGNLGGGGITLDSSTGAGMIIDRGATTNVYYLRFYTAGTEKWAIGNKQKSNEELHFYRAASSTPSMTLDESDLLSLSSGTGINEFSIDGTFAGNSDDAVPTEQAVKTYVDTITSGLSLDSIYEGDSKVEVVDTTAESYITFKVDNSELMRLDSAGLILSSGTGINEFSIDGTLAGDSDDAVPTEKAVKNYVDNAGGGTTEKHLDSWNPDSVDTGVETGNIFNMIETLRFDPSADGAAWHSFRLPDTFSTSSDINIKIEYAMSTETTGNLEFEISWWVLNDGDTPVEATPDSTSSINFSTSVGNTHNFKTLTNCELDAADLTATDCRIIVKLKRNTDISSNHNGWAEIAGVVAYQT